jgi:hypothetical protein
MVLGMAGEQFYEGEGEGDEAQAREGRSQAEAVPPAAVERGGSQSASEDCESGGDGSWMDGEGARRRQVCERISGTQD